MDRSRTRLVRLPWLAVLLLGLLGLSLVHAAPQDSNLVTKITRFENAPKKLFYFKDSSVILYLEAYTGRVWRSANEGKDWSKVTDIPDSSAYDLIQHPFEDSTAVVITLDKKHYITVDKGLNWDSFTTPQPPSSLAPGSLIRFHAKRAGYMIYFGEECDSSLQCNQVAYYTENFFRTTPSKLLSYVSDCTWALGSAAFDNAPTDTIFCTEFPDSAKKGSQSSKNIIDLRLVRSSTFFAGDKKDVISINGGAVSLGLIEKYLVVVSMKPNNEGHELYVSTDGQDFERAKFPTAISTNQMAYTILESSKHSLMVDILRGKPNGQAQSFGTLLYSNSNGSYFVSSLEHTNRNKAGLVDFERIQTPVYSGILFANVVDNWEEMQSGDRSEDDKRLVSKISFHEGSKWTSLKPPAKNADGRSWDCSPTTDTSCKLHLHSITRPHNIGRVFSTMSAPGIIIGVGSVGKYLQPYRKCDTFLSADGGLTWTAIYKGPHKYESGDMGSLIVLVPDQDSVDYVLYSWNRGKDWTKHTLQLDGGKSWQPWLTMIDPESTSTKMIILVTDASDLNSLYVVHLDFEKTLSRKCDIDPQNPGASRDVEEWMPQKEAYGGSCVMGQETGYYRRKADADCYIGQKFHKLQLDVKKCPCTDDDFECDYNFAPDPQTSSSLKCIQAGPIHDQPLDCKVGKQYKGKSGYRKIPGNVCEGGVNRAEPVLKDCQKLDDGKNGGNGGNGKVELPEGNQPKITRTTLSDDIDRFYYFPNSSHVMLRTENNGEIWKSDDEGLNWRLSTALAKQGGVLLAGIHESVPTRAYFFVSSGQATWYTDDRLGDSESSLKKLDTPAPYNTLGVEILDYHPDHPDYLVFVSGGQGCPDARSCFTTAHITKDHGKSWTTVDTWVQKCVWARDFGFATKNIPDDAVYCMGFKYKGGDTPQDAYGGHGTKENPMQLVMIQNGGKSKRVLLEKGVANFYVVKGVLVVAVENGNDLQLKASTDGVTFVDAQFPPNIHIEKASYTILESTSNGLFIDVAQSLKFGQEYGALFGSNENGTFYTRSLANTNRNMFGQVDVEKMHGIEGIVVANQIANVDQLTLGAKKQIKTMITYDDGATWKVIIPPKTDSQGSEFCSGKSLESCHLNLYAAAQFDRTEIVTRHSAKGAPGTMVAVGSVGGTLAKYTESDMFMTRDGGQTWSEIRKEAHLWALGDHGSIIVLVNDEEPVNVISYSWDFGVHWAEHRFSDKNIKVTGISSVPDGTGRRFIITGMYPRSSWEEIFEDPVLVLIGIDMTPLFERQCVFDKNAKGDSADFEKWSLHDPNQATDGSRCFLGQKIEYWRRKEEAVCYIGHEFESLEQNLQVCECSESDYECDVDFWRDATGKCVLYGKDPQQPAKCPKGKTYKGRSGYRKLSASRCKGGLDKTHTIERECDDFVAGTGEIVMNTRLFEHSLQEYMYYNGTSTIVILDVAGNLWQSHDNGIEWKEMLTSQSFPVQQIYQDPFRPKRAYFLARKGAVVYYSDDQGKTLHHFQVPNVTPIAGLYDAVPLITHPEEPDWLLFTAGIDCGDTSTNTNCHTETFYSKDHGQHWYKIDSYTRSCLWGRGAEFNGPNKDTVFCTAYRDKKGSQILFGPRMPIDLSVTNDLGRTWTRLFERGFRLVINEEYMIAAVQHPEKSEIELQVTRDGVNWSPAVFPSDFVVPEHGYTVLDSHTGFLNVDVFVNTLRGKEFGALFRSNANGTIFTRARDHTNRNTDGYVDYEKMQGVEGIALLNEVQNANQVLNGATKSIRTVITYDEGETWLTLKPPSHDSQGARYSCEGSECYLNLHSFTERRDKNDMFSSSSAIGLIMGVGNVGSSLTEYNHGDVFLSNDAGQTWTEITKDAHLYEFGDHGSIMLLVNDEQSTDYIKYSTNSGQSFSDYKITTGELSGVKFRVTHLVTEPHGMQSHFILFGRVSGGDRGQSFHGMAAVHLDFSKIWTRKCELNEKNPEASDYELWSLPKLNGGKCAFGKEVKYYRRKRDRDCQIGENYRVPQSVTSCECTREDFECDNLYYLDPSGNGKCIPTPNQRRLQSVCRDGKMRITKGYIKLKNSGCSGGVESEYEAEYRTCSTTSGSSTVLTVLWYGLLSAGFAGGVTFCFVQYKRKYGNTGRIRLPDDETGMGESTGRYADDMLERATAYFAAAWGYIREASELVGERLRGVLGPSWGRLVARLGGRRPSAGQGYSAVQGDEFLVFENDTSLEELEDY
ncbi:uncharacterized protein BJ171DRAFT_445237 [Polychytrium aggregatum]|uniref:uncharacterized protein n=1 Tax=Polychytrium aggregatum TaxID=110093 RepID=UPI0022FF3BAE|nr:uncharacterized protein BJ171DRAFT_445237 [Polychytrium aggregatum]KAI9199686.1 hypothetical protein BJ171DRAFT_445237 [Polychytrium aggregatum]